MSYTFNTQAYGASLGTGGPTTTSLTVNTGDTIVGAVCMTGGSLPNFALSDGNNTYALNLGGIAISTAAVAITFASSPSGTSATLSATFSGTTGSYICVFSDGEMRYVGTVTNGSTTSLSWGGTSTLTGGALTGSPTTSANLYLQSSNVMLPVYALNCMAGSYAVSISGTFSVLGIYFANYSGISGAPTSSGNGFYGGSSTGNDKVVTSSLTIATPSMLWGICLNQNGPVGGTPLAGTSPTAFTGHGGIAWNANNPALAEDALVSSSVSATFGTAVGYDSYYAVGMSFALGSGITPILMGGICL